MNCTSISLILKVENPHLVKELRPISIYNVIYRILFKTLTNILKDVMTKLVSENQNAFAKGRVIDDNCSITNEVITKIKQQKGNMTLIHSKKT